jgi:signal transduction histidine kinase
MAAQGSDNEQRVLVLAPAGKDAPMACDVLASHGLTAVACADLDALCDKWRGGAGLLLIAEEALFPAGIEILAARLAEQPAWSDIPVLVFLRGAATGTSIDRLRALRNVAVLERPVRIPALSSTIRAALRARMRQYEVRDLMAELREANRAKDDFLAMVSHELRTPLNVIRGTAQLLAHHQGSESMSRAVEKIGRNAEILSRLVEDLLDLSRLQKHGLQLSVEPVDLVAVLNAAVDMNRLAADTKGVHIFTEFEPVRGFLLGDVLRLQQVVSNLLSNAIKFTPSDGTVTLHLHSTYAQAQITVMDTGEGVSAELLPHVFEPFRQGVAAPRADGLGLGLAIARQFVELHGGSVSAQSRGAGLGATFSVFLPLQPASSALTA